jgi:hypothetical protein
VNWPSEDYGDFQFKRKIQHLKDCFISELDETVRGIMGTPGYLSVNESAQEIMESNKKCKELENGIITKYKYQVELERFGYEERKIKTEPLVQFNCMRSILFFGDKECPIQPNSTQYQVCKFFFEKWPSGELIDNDAVYKGIGEDPDENDSGPVRTAALEINKKTRGKFGFPVFRTPKGQIGINRDTLIKP